MKIGIDKIGFYTSDLFVDMNQLAIARDEDPKKYTLGLGQTKMSVVRPSQDVVTLAANAADSILTPEDIEKIDLVILGTESGVDHSKAAAIQVANLLGLRRDISAFEIKEACFGVTAGLQMAKGHVALHPDSKVLVIGSDIARYGLNTKGEPTQGGGAVAMVISQDPHILALSDTVASYTQDIMDFWRPVGFDHALVDGKFSAQAYLDFLSKTYSMYRQRTGFRLEDFSAFVFHLPFSKMGIKAMDQVILKYGDSSEYIPYMTQFEYSRQYNMQVGNIYTGSLYLSLISLLEHSPELRPGKRIGLFSYGSGAVGQFFSGLLQPWYKSHLNCQYHQEFLANRTEVTVPEYEALFAAFVTDGQDCMIDYEADPAKFVFTGIVDNKRQYLRR